MINIEGLNKAEVLRDLYNASKVQGLGFLQAVPGQMTTADAQAIMDVHGTYFDYLQGKVMKIDLASDIEFEEWLYDRDNGPGSAKRVIDRLRCQTMEKDLRQVAHDEWEKSNTTTEIIKRAASGCEAQFLDN